MILSPLAALLPLLGLAVAKSSTGNSVLVVLEPTLERDSFSLFFDGLQERGYDLTFRAPKDVTPVVLEYDVPTFSHVILFTPETKIYAQDITPQSLVTMLSGNANLLVALSSKQTPLSTLASEFSLVLPPPGTPLLSHFPKRDTEASVIPITPSSGSIFTSTRAPVWFSGVAHARGSNPLLVPILNAPVESFCADSVGDSGSDAVVDAADKGGEGLWAGGEMGVVSGFQTTGGARVAWVGGVEMFGDAFARKEVSPGVMSGNQQFASDLAAWTFQESLVFRIDNTTHHRVGETKPQEHYTTKDDLVYTAHISAYDPISSTWKPHSSIQDMQLEFTMLDPHIRTALLPVAGSPGKYEATFRAPDRHGVFKFIINYKRKGLSFLQSSTTVPVVPPRHDGYPRFLSVAWPYYAGALSTSVGFLLFSALWLGGDAKELGKSLRKKGKTE